MSKNTESMRLNKHLALHLGISRREADELIASGKVKVDDQVASLGQQVLPRQNITINNQPVKKSVSKKYIALNKPVGYVCSRRRQGETPTIYELLPDSMQNLKTVGRLDKDSSGIIILTNDGDFAHQMTHPKFGKEKVYEVRLDKNLATQDKEAIEKGINLEDGPSKLLVKEFSDKKYLIKMHEGRNRQIRRTFAALGYKVTKLHRIKFGKFEIKNNLPPGKFEEVSI